MASSDVDKGLSERFEKELAAVKNDITQLTERIGEALNALSGEAASQARRGYRQARRGINSVLSDAQAQGSATMEAAQSAAASIEESAEEAIRERPLTTLAVALGVGFLIGMAWRR
ncbi:MAG: DUF883 domain-containing protein [Xanthobacteraceae bacterium]|nr:DUF883 domain-containing protein [Xanthobacteraceae bacterium]